METGLQISAYKSSPSSREFPLWYDADDEDVIHLVSSSTLWRPREEAEAEEEWTEGERGVRKYSLLADRRLCAAGRSSKWGYKAAACPLFKWNSPSSVDPERVGGVLSLAGNLIGSPNFGYRSEVAVDRLRLIDRRIVAMLLQSYEEAAGRVVAAWPLVMIAMVVGFVGWCHLPRQWVRWPQ